VRWQIEHQQVLRKGMRRDSIATCETREHVDGVAEYSGIHRVKSIPDPADSEQAQLPPAQEIRTDAGPLLLPAHDQVMRPLIARTGDWEVNEAMLFRAHINPGANIVDVGAHVGYYTLIAARTTGPNGNVIAVEPDPVNSALLRENVRRNQLPNVTVVEAAAWRETGRLALQRDADNTGDHRIAEANGTPDALEVDAVALDEIVAEMPVTVVKVDTQATDHVVLEGMQRTLERYSSIVFAEFWPTGIREFGDDPVAVVEFYRSLGFRLTMPGIQAAFESWSAEEFVHVADVLPGGFGTLVLRRPNTP
jgi:FkbM family methyltransferase